jgi:hypothetical protein
MRPKIDIETIDDSLTRMVESRIRVRLQQRRTSAAIDSNRSPAQEKIRIPSRLSFKKAGQKGQESSCLKLNQNLPLTLSWYSDPDLSTGYCLLFWVCDLSK